MVDKDMIDNLLVSVIIPAYNSEKYIVRCLNSVFKQTHTNIEVILINDGSNDRTGELCEEYMKSESRLKYFYTDNGGVSSARNKALSLAKGNYIVFVDADDIVSPRYVECLLKGFKNNSIGISIATFSFNEEDLVTNEAAIEVDEWEVCVALKESIVYGKFQGNICSKMYRRDIVDTLRFNEEIKLAEDRLFLFDALLKCEKVAYQETVLYLYVQHKGSAMESPFDSRCIQEAQAYELIYKNCCEKIPKEESIFRKSLIDGYVFILRRGFGTSSKDNYRYLESLLENFKKIDLGSMRKYYTFKMWLRIVMMRVSPHILKMYGKYFNG